jgi:hypothetical protein
MDFGLALPLVLYSVDEQKSSWELGLRPGFLSRFLALENQLALEAADFRLGIFLAHRKGNWSARAEVFHLSSHRGLDLTDSDTPRFSYSREAVQTLVAYGRSGRWRVYAGPTAVLRTHPSLGRWTLQAGMEYYPKMLSRPHSRLYLAGDVQSREEIHWNPNISLEPGILFTTSDGEPVVRLGGWLYRGQVPFGQFFEEKENQAGVQLTVELRPSTKPFRGHRK